MIWNRQKLLNIFQAPDDLGTGGASSDTSEDILDVFKMDFDSQTQESGEEEKQAPAESTPSEPEVTNPESQSASDPETSNTEPVVNQPTQPAEPQGPTAEALLAQAMEVNKRLSEQLARQQAPAEPSQPEEDEDTKVFAEKKFSDYTFNINPQLYDGLFNPEASQETKIQCLQAYASGIATTVHNNILKTLGAWTKQNFEAVPGAVRYLIEQHNQATQSTQQIRDSFYKNYPDLQKPELYPLIKATIQAVQKETQAKTWSNDFAAKVASRVRGVLSGYAQASKPKAAAPIMTPAAAKPAPQIVDKDPNGIEEILATLNSEF